VRFLASIASILLVIAIGQFSWAQGTAKERVFSQSVQEVQAAVKKLPGGISGQLPVLDGFVTTSAGSLDHYQRPFYQCTVRVASAPSGSATKASIVRVAAKITAWNSEPAHSGYEVLQSNGRLETDLLDRLQDVLATTGKRSPPNTHPRGEAVAKTEISAPMPQFPKISGTTLSGATGSRPQDPALEQEAKNLEEILRSQSHPTNLVAVKQDQTPLLQNPSSNSKVLFLASAEDEFEVLDVNPEWVHVRVSGLSRGWLRRSAIEILDLAEPAKPEPGAAAIKESPPKVESAEKAGAFSISSEEVGNFPGDWAPLKGKSVKIISVQQAPGTGRITSPADKLRFAESVLKKENLSTSAAAEGLVLIFDAEDGGMVASTRDALERLKKGTISEQAFWKECFLDPPEILGTAN
jgi:hypothetical protein